VGPEDGMVDLERAERGLERGDWDGLGEEQ
jgi:hypothetical protein